MTATAAPTSGSNLLRLILPTAAFVTIHVAILAGAIPVAVAVVFFSLAFAPAATALRTEGSHRWLYAVIAMGLLALAACALAWPGVDGRVALILPAFAGSTLVSAFFAYSLLPGQIPVIVRMCHVTRGKSLPAGLDRYARRLTWGWAILPAFLGCAALAILAALGLEAWSWASNVANPIILTTFFAGEHLYRAWRMPYLGKPSILKTFNIMINSDTWRRSA